MCHARLHVSIWSPPRKSHSKASTQAKQTTHSYIPNRSYQPQRLHRAPKSESKTSNSNTPTHHVVGGAEDDAQAPAVVL